MKSRAKQEQKKKLNKTSTLVPHNPAPCIYNFHATNDDNSTATTFRQILIDVYWNRFIELDFMSFELRYEKVWWTISYVRDIYTLSAVKGLYLFLCPLNSFTQAPVSRFHSDTIVPDPTARWPWCKKKRKQLTEQKIPWFWLPSRFVFF